MVVRQTGVFSNVGHFDRLVAATCFEVSYMRYFIDFELGVVDIVSSSVDFEHSDFATCIFHDGFGDGLKFLFVLTAVATPGCVENDDIVEGW